MAHGIPSILLWILLEMALPQTEVFEDEFTLIRSCAALNEIRLAQDIKELTIEVKNGDVLHAHRIILAARIPFLRESLSGPFSEENSILRWPTVPLSLANTLLHFAYTGQAEITQGNARGIVTLARMLKIPELLKWGVTFMSKGVNLENLSAIWDFAKSLDIELLMGKCISLMKAHFKDVVSTDIFVRLPAETVFTLLRSEDLSVASEEQVIAVVKVPDATAATDGEEALVGIFGGHDGDKRRLSSSEVYEVRQDRWHKLPDMPEARWGPAAACLPGDSRVFVFGGQDDSSPVLASVIFCHLRADWREKTTTADFWLSAAPMRTARRGLAAAPFRGAILVAGGYDGGKTLNVVEMFLPPEARCPLGQWTELAGTKQSRSWFGLLTSTDTVFALGDESGLQNTVEALTSPGGATDFDSDLTSWIWSSKNPVETLCRVFGAASIRM